MKATSIILSGVLVLAACLLRSSEAVTCTADPTVTGCIDCTTSPTDPECKEKEDGSQEARSKEARCLEEECTKEEGPKAQEAKPSGLKPTSLSLTIIVF
ncbi:uncharacterized protein Dere_GG16859 [Drosophila erecta]|uniref:GG16859 n=1 Tax=Drosophila erecta TaxID=7220 RepID=B3P3K6_DROER|nr:uncharacterized protein Dere_GG16859 [Drosophila erecta]